MLTKVIGFIVIIGILLGLLMLASWRLEHWCQELGQTWNEATQECDTAETFMAPVVVLETSSL